MKRSTLLLALAMLLPLAAQAAEVKVEFKEPDKMVDPGNRGRERDRNFKTLTEYLQKLGARLPASQSLSVEFTALDLAGQYEPWHSQPGNDDIRYLRSSTWPSAKLHFKLSEGDKTLSEGEDSIADMNYQLTVHSDNGDRLFYDKRMLQTWFDKRFLSSDKP
jgi:hypothetical protein